jgi:hypothetical protein
MTLTRKDVINTSCESTTVMKASLTLTGRSSISSVSCVSAGTVFNMRVIIVAQVSENDVGEARLSSALDQGSGLKEVIHTFSSSHSHRWRRFSDLRQN